MGSTANVIVATLSFFFSSLQLLVRGRKRERERYGIALFSSNRSFPRRSPLDRCCGFSRKYADNYNRLNMTIFGMVQFMTMIRIPSLYGVSKLYNKIPFYKHSTMCTKENQQLSTDNDWHLRLWFDSLTYLSLTSADYDAMMRFCSPVHPMCASL